MTGLAAGTLYNLIKINAEPVTFSSSYSTLAAALAKKLARLQHAEGFVEGAETSITSSRGDSLLIETTAISLLAWMEV